jgi:hypothetical protein
MTVGEAAVERSEGGAGGTYRPPELTQLARAAVATSLGDDEGWLRNLLNACQHALHDLRQIPGSRVQAPITDLEHVCAKVQAHLDALALQGTSPAR